MDRIIEIGPDTVRVEAGCNILALNTALRAKGRELPIFPSTQDIATIGGFIAGGSAGIGTVSHGMLRDPGNIIEIRALSVEETPRELSFRATRSNLIHHAMGHQRRDHRDSRCAPTRPKTGSAVLRPFTPTPPATVPLSNWRSRQQSGESFARR